MGILQRIDRQLALFQRVSSRADVGFDGAGSFGLEHDLRRALPRCVFCREADACGKWLDSGTDAQYPDFCPNAAYLTRYGQEAAAERKPLAA